MAAIKETIKNYIAENILFTDKGYPYPDNASFLENGIVDSMNVMEIVAYVEETFNISIEDSEIEPANFDSIESIANFIERKTN